MYHILQSLHIMCLHGDALIRASRDHRGFLIWCQENLLIEKYEFPLEFKFCLMQLNVS
jgi:hypothetical protein